MCRKWCDYDYYKLSDKVVLDGLRDLGYFLDIHYNSKLYVHIDEYDSVITELMFDVEDELKKKKTIELIVSQISGLLKGNNYVERGIVTGITHMVGSGFSKLNNLKFL